MKYLTLLPVIIILLCTLVVIIHTISFIHGNRANGPFPARSCASDLRPAWQARPKTHPSCNCDLRPDWWAEVDARPLSSFSSDDSFNNVPPDVPKHNYPELSQFVEKVKSGCYKEAISCLPDELLQFLCEYRRGSFDKAFSLIDLASHDVQKNESSNWKSSVYSASEIYDNPVNNKPDSNKNKYEYEA